MSSQAYRDNIYQNNRITVPEVIYNLTAPDSKDGGSLSLPEGNALSRPWQAMNEVRAINSSVATLEPDYWRLDGSFILPPKPDEQPGTEIGYWSADMSDENGEFTEPLVIERVFDNIQKFNTLGISFDAASNNYCTDFEVFFYNAFGGLIYSERMTGNDSAYRRTSKAGEGILRVVVKLYKTNRPFRYARVIEADFGMILEYDDSVIQSVSLVREADIDGRTFPFPELRVKIWNKGLYDLLDNATYAPYFQTRQRFEYRHGLVLPDKSVEFADCGKFILSDWDVSDGSVEFIATGQSSLFAESTYFGSSFQEFTVAQLVHKSIPQAGITLDSPRITGYFGNVSYRRLIAMLSELSCCLVYEDKNYSIQFSDILSKESSKVADVVDYRSLLRRNPTAKNKEYYNAINLTEYTVSREYRQISRTEQQPGEIAIYFNNPVAGGLEFEVPPGFELLNVIVCTMYMTAVLTGNGTAEITIWGESITLTKSEVLYRAPWHSGHEPDTPYKVDLPCMIRTEVVH